MRVTSDLADLEIQLGRITRSGDELLVESAPGSSLEARIRVDAADARSMLGKVLKSPAVWAFLVRLPFTGWRRPHGKVKDTTQDTRDNPAWQARRESIGLNKPW